MKGKKEETVLVTVDNSGRSQRSKKKGKTAKAMFFTLVSIIGVGTIVGLSVALVYSEDKIQREATFRREMESVYSKSYYDLLAGTNDLDVKLKKLSVASSMDKQQSLLYEIWGSACIAENNLSNFESNDEGLKNAVKFVNQLGDYSHYLALKISSGEPISAEEKQKLTKLSEMMTVFKGSLKNVQKGLDEGKLFMSNGGVLGDFSESFSDFSNPSLEYPEMIYDGPFSDALDKRECRALTGAEIDQKMGVEKLKKYFSDRAVSNIEYNGETNGKIVTLNYSFELDGSLAFAQLAKKGGMLASFNMNSEKTTAKSNPVTCTSSAMSFANKLGFKNMQVVWSAEANGQCFVNLAPVINDTIIYPDLVKIKLDHKSGDVLGIDCMHYIFNHVERQIVAPVLSESEARKQITMSDVSVGRLALIPLQETREVLTYEFECQSNGTYFVYIDAMTGREANILFVLDNTPQGQVLQ